MFCKRSFGDSVSSSSDELSLSNIFYKESQILLGQERQSLLVICIMFIGSGTFTFNHFLLFFTLLKLYNLVLSALLSKKQIYPKFENMLNLCVSYQRRNYGG